MCIPLLLNVCTRIILLFFKTLSPMDQLIRTNEEQHYFDNVICELYLGSPERWGPRQYSQQILNLFWTANINYTERFQLATFVQNNPLPRYIFYRWIDHIGQCRDISAINHFKSFFSNWDNGVHLEYYSFCIINQRFETLSGNAVSFHRPTTSDNSFSTSAHIDEDGFSTDSELDNPNSCFNQALEYSSSSSESSLDIPCGQSNYQDVGLEVIENRGRKRPLNLFLSDTNSDTDN